MLADLQLPSLQENERLGSEYDVVCFVSEYVACFVLAARHVVARRRHLYRPRLPSYGDLLSAGLERPSSISLLLQAQKSGRFAGQFFLIFFLWAA